MEQNRASSLLVHQYELAWQTAPHDPAPRNTSRTYQVIVSLIAATTTEKGLKVQAALDPATYPAGIKVSDAEVEELNLKPARFHGEWNYSLVPATDLART